MFLWSVGPLIHEVVQGLYHQLCGEQVGQAADTLTPIVGTARQGPQDLRAVQSSILCASIFMYMYILYIHDINK